MALMGMHPIIWSIKRTADQCPENKGGNRFLHLYSLLHPFKIDDKYQCLIRQECRALVHSSGRNFLIGDVLSCGAISCSAIWLCSILLLLHQLHLVYSFHISPTLCVFLSIPYLKCATIPSVQMVVGIFDPIRQPVLSILQSSLARGWIYGRCRCRWWVSA